MTFRPIRRRVTGVVLAAVLLTLTLSTIGFLSLQYLEARERVESELRAAAGLTSTGLAYVAASRRNKAAEQMLESLHTRSVITEGHLIPAGASRPIASIPSGAQVPQGVYPRPPGFHSDRAGNWLVEELLDERGRPFATILLRAPSTKPDERLWIRMILAVATLALGVGLLFAHLLHRGLTVPLASLEQSVRAIAARGEPGLRVTRSSDDEVGRLADHVNSMLEAFEAQSRTARESESAYRVLFEQSPFAVFLLRKSGEITDLSARALQDLGRTREEVLGKTAEALGLINRQTGRMMSAALRRSGGQIDREEIALGGGGGRVRHALLWATVISLRGEEQVLMMMEDITERKLAEEALRESERVYREAIEGAGAVPYAKMEDPRRFVFMGSGIKELTGYTEKEMTPDLWGSIVRQVVPQGEGIGLDMREAIRRVYEGQIHSWKADVLIQTRQGELRWVTDSSVVLRDPDRGVVMGSVGILSDITDRKRAEEALRLGEERFRTLVTNLQVVAYAIDSRGVFTLSEGLGLQKLGLRPGQVVGLSVFDVYNGHAALLDQIRRALAGESVFADLSLMGLTFEVHYTPVRDSSGAVTGVIGVAFDITERTRAEEEIRRLNVDLERRVQDRTARLEAANRELEAFAYSVSHDLRAPLRAVDGFSQALKEDYAAVLDARGQGYVERIRTAAERMGSLIDDLLRLSRLSSAEMTLESVDISALASAIAGELRETQPGREVTFEITPGIRVWADPALARIALDNLLRNAWKFTGRTPGARIEVGSYPDPSRGEVCFIRDNGAGFDMAYASRLFGVFQRLHDQHDFPGSGIGLATVQRILHRHGGQVWAEGAVNHGATIHFCFPPPPSS